MTQEERIIKAKINLLVSQPWFGQLACYLNLRQRTQKEIPTAAINERGDFFYCDEFVKTLGDPELKGLVCHEILHLAFQHPFRLQTRNPIVWNIAADLKVNDELHGSNVQLPAQGLKPQFGDWSLGKVSIRKIGEKTTEQIYEELLNKLPRVDVSVVTGADGKQGVQVNTGNLPKLWKDLIDKMIKDLLKTLGKDDPKPQEAQRMEREWQERVSTANQMNKGDVPAGLRRELDALENPELPWHQIIRQRFQKLEKFRTWAKPNKRYMPLYFPGIKKNKTLKAVVAIDTSGSMSQQDITRAISETWGLANAFKRFTLYIIFNDADVWDVVEVKNGNKSKIARLQPKGGGGTDFRPVFKLIKKQFANSIDCLVFFTDGYGDFPSSSPYFSTYWVTQSDDVKWPFGKVIKLRPR